MNTQTKPGLRTLTLTRGRLELVLDLDEVFDDDPGRGTPAIVRTTDGRSEGTYWCAKDTGELICGRDTVTLTGPEMAWLNSEAIVDQVELFLYGAP